MLTDTAARAESAAISIPTERYIAQVKGLTLKVF
jgi:hypothetical protein